MREQIPVNPDEPGYEENLRQAAESEGGMGRRLFLTYGAALASIPLLTERINALPGAASVLPQRPVREPAPPAPAAGKRLAMVNVMQGTDSVREFSHGNVLPLICTPFGMTDWSLQNYGGINERFFFQSRRTTFHGIRATHQPSSWAG